MASGEDLAYLGKHLDLKSVRRPHNAGEARDPHGGAAMTAGQPESGGFLSVGESRALRFEPPVHAGRYAARGSGHRKVGRSGAESIEFMNHYALHVGDRRSRPIVDSDIGERIAERLFLNRVERPCGLVFEAVIVAEQVGETVCARVVLKDELGRRLRFPVVRQHQPDLLLVLEEILLQQWQDVPAEHALQGLHPRRAVLW